MISKKMNDAIAAIALLTQSEQERLIAFLQGPASIMSEPVQTELPKPKPISRVDNRFKRWSDEDTQRLEDFMEDSTIMSDRSQRQSWHELCRELGREESGIRQKMKKLKNKATQ